jgi:(p)ppGpp synthase/HD superfamily hydrolase
MVAKHTTDYELQAAALLHDVVEDCGVTNETLMTEFNSNTARLVQELTNDYSDHLQGDEKIEAIKKHAEHMSPEAVLIKLCDRLDNLNDLDNWKPARVLRYFRQTMEMLNVFPEFYFNRSFGAEEDRHTYPRQQLRNEIRSFIKDNTVKYMEKV